ncbi:glycosyltransferase family 39 protein [Patescibacteria group bacterium]|nr:glycosyltransferase family 39 protein [Patescibacteria group bacterium]
MSVFYISPGYEIAKDAVTYHEAVRFLEGDLVDGRPIYNRLLTTPLMLLSATVVDFFANNIYGSMAVVNILFYFLIVIVFYKLVFEIFKDSKIAIFSSILFFCNYYIINIENAFLTDMAGRFFLILTSLLAVKYFLRQENIYYYLAILSSAVGVFFKEFGGLGIISLACLIFLSEISWKEKIKKTLMAGALFLIPLLIYHLWFYFYFNFSYFNWYQYAVDAYVYDSAVHGFVPFIKVMGWLFLAGWPIFLFGLCKVFTNLDIKNKVILLGLLPASLSFFAWPVFMQRTAFILVPWLSLIAGYGLSFIKNKYIIIILLGFYLLVNYNIERLLPIINLSF